MYESVSRHIFKFRWCFFFGFSNCGVGRFMLELQAMTYYRKIAEIVIILIGLLVGAISTILLHLTHNDYADVYLYKYIAK